MSATTSGSDAKRPSASTGHNDGSSTRAWTAEQKAAVVRVRKCQPTAFYDILGLETVKTTIDESGIKKAYRKQSLLTHPDKNGYTGADEAFKMVSRAFQILGDVDKRRMFDQTGGDPDSRSGGGAPASNPFSGFAQRGGGGMGQRGFEAEISPEELFRQFFGGGMGGGFGSPFGGGLFDTGPGFVFNMGGGPGVRVHQFGGRQPRRRPAGQAADPNAPPRTASSALMNLLPLLILFILPIISSLFGSDDSSSSSSRGPKFSIDTPKHPMTFQHTTYNLRVPYFVEPQIADSYSKRQWRQLDDRVEQKLANQLNYDCTREIEEREAVVRSAAGWFSHDQEIMQRAREMPMLACHRMNKLGLRRNYQ